MTMGLSDRSYGLQLAWLLFLSFVAFITPTGSIRLTGCGDGNLTVVDKKDGIYLNCYFSADQPSSVNWTWNSDNGTTTLLATCYPPYDCVRFLRPVGPRIALYSTRIYLGYYRPPRDFSGTVTCTETTNRTKKSAACRIRIVRVRIGNIHDQETFDGRVNGSSVIYCYYSPISPSTLTWTLTTGTGQTLQLGTCSSVSSCESLYEPNISFSRNTTYTRAVFDQIQRDWGGRISCSFTHNGVTETDDAILNVYHLPTIENCSASIFQQNWSAVLSCDITRMFSSADITKVRVFAIFQYAQKSLTFSGGHHLGQRSYSKALTSYTNSTDNKQYRRGWLVYSWNVPSLPALYYRFHYYVYAGISSYSSAVTENGMFNISTPATLVHNCTNVRYIPETGGTTCMCTSDDLGSPAGRLIWLLGDDVIIAGDYGHKQLLFPPDSMRRNVDRMAAMCQLDWIQPQQVALPLNIAYGPENVQLLVNKQYDADNQLSIVLDCHVTEVNPMTPDMVEWEGPCQDQEGFTCTLDPRVTDVEGKSVTCRVTNAANNGHSAEATVVITGAPTGPVVTDEMTDRIMWAAVGGGVVLGVVLVIVLLVVLVKKCRSGCSCQSLPAWPGTDPTYDNPSFGGDAGDI